MKSQYQTLKEEAFEANLQIPKNHLAIYTWGNVSAFDKSKAIFAIKPSGVPYDKLSAEDMVIMDLEGKKIEGKLNPSSDTKTHVILYRNFEGIGGITHTHSPNATAWAQACRSIPLLGTTHADHGCRPILCARFLTEEEVKQGYEINTGNVIVETMKNPSSAFPTQNGSPLPTEPLNPAVDQMILLAGHGPFTWGNTAEKSVYNASALEQIAQMAMWVSNINPEYKTLPQHIINKHYTRKHGKDAYYGQGN